MIFPADGAVPIFMEMAFIIQHLVHYCLIYYLLTFYFSISFDSYSELPFPYLDYKCEKVQFSICHFQRLRKEL
jgi:hypothetical protein